MAKPRKSKEEKALEAKVEAIVKATIANVQIDIMDLGKISDEGMRAGREAYEGLKAPFVKDINQLVVTEAIESAVESIVTKLRKN
jgi:hypothetical protein